MIKQPSKETADVSLDQAVTKSANFNHKTDITEKWNDSIDEEISQIDKYKYQQ